MKQTIISHIKVGRRAKEFENFPNNWESLDINNLEIPKGRVILLFGGNTTNRPEAANGNAKIIQSLLSDMNRDKTSILSFMYDTEPIRSQGYLDKTYYEEAIMLFHKSIKPLLYDDEGNIKEMRGIEQVLGRVSFVAHCGGSCFVDVIIDQIYDILTQKYPEKTAEILINKIQYFAYAPNEIPSHNVNAFFVTPFSDPNWSWMKPIELAGETRVDVDYPKGVIKKLLKAKQQMVFEKVFESCFDDSRAIMFKLGNSTFFIPHKMNAHTNIGDHSIECIAKPQFLNDKTNFGVNARIANYASRLYLNAFLSSNVLDAKKAFNMVIQNIEEAPSEIEK